MTGLAVRQEAGSAGRVRCPLQAEAALLALSPLVVCLCPPVGRPTRVHLLLGWAHALALAHLATAAYLEALTRALRRIHQAHPANPHAPRHAAWAKDVLAAARHGWSAGRCGGPDKAGLEPGRGAGYGAEGDGAGDEGGGGRGLGEMLDALRTGLAHSAAAAAAHSDGPEEAGPRNRPGAEAEAGDDWAGAGTTWGHSGPAGSQALCGLVTIGPHNAAAWRRHVTAVDAAVRVCGPGLCAVAAVAILGGMADMPLPSTLPLDAL